VVKDVFKEQQSSMKQETENLQIEVIFILHLIILYVFTGSWAKMI
jgi:hypothetical protein